MGCFSTKIAAARAMGVFSISNKSAQLAELLLAAKRGKHQFHRPFH